MKLFGTLEIVGTRVRSNTYAEASRAPTNMHIRTARQITAAPDALRYRSLLILSIIIYSLLRLPKRIGMRVAGRVAIASVLWLADAADISPISGFQRKLAPSALPHRL